MKKYLVCAALLLAAPHARADEATFVLKNAQPSLVARLLDSAHQSEPPEITMFRRNAGLAGISPAKGENAPGLLPRGIEKLTPDDAKNSLTATGTAQGLAALREVIAVLDAPLRQVELEAQLVEMSAEHLKIFGVKPLESTATPDAATPDAATPNAATPDAATWNIRTVRLNFRAALSALEAQGRAKTFSAPRVTAINNRAASIHTETVTPLLVPRSTDGLFEASKIFVVTRIGLSATPTINNDDTISMRIASPLSRGIMLPKTDHPDEPDGASWIPIAKPDSNHMPTIANVRDGDTIVISNFAREKQLRAPILADIPTVGKFFESQPRPRELVLFITARIIRRVDDSAPGK